MRARARVELRSRGLHAASAALDLLVRRTAGEDLAQDRAEREDVRALVELLDFALRCSGAMYAACPSPSRPASPSARRPAAAHGLDHRVHASACARFSSATPPRLQHLREAPVDDLHLAEARRP
jgi:hypothetical protein